MSDQRASTLKKLAVQCKNQPLPPGAVAPPPSVIWWRSTKQAASTQTASIGGGSGKTVVASDFLLSRVETFFVALISDAMQPPSLSPEELAAEILALLRSKRALDDLQQPLLELLGFSDAAFALVQTVLASRGAIVAAAGTKPAAAAAPPSQQKKSLLDIRPSALGDLALLDTPAALPAGTSRQWLPIVQAVPTQHQHMLEQVRVPPPKPAVDSATAPLVPTSALQPQSQKAFAGIRTLNRLQSHLFQATYLSSENILVCAPTGAGKTNVAMLALCREIERAPTPQLVKAVYVAPMKALAQEVVAKFAERLRPLHMVVRELTGDMQLTRGEIDATQVIVTTPEKWDVITRKSNELTDAVQLLIIDEVHLVGEDRGPVIECLVARTLRLVEQKQRMIRIVALSATLPNYNDVATFLRVNPRSGLFYFNASFRPVPLEQTFCGVKLAADAEHAAAKSPFQKKQMVDELMTQVALDKAADALARGHQVMVFVHARKDTGKTARDFVRLAELAGKPLPAPPAAMPAAMALRLSKSKNAELRQLAPSGLAVHHAGMAREDRGLVEEMFSAGAVSILVCTATLAWGVNLPAHMVIVKGTQIYAPERGGLCELSSADVFQCFGRAGRPQFDTSGEAVLITEHATLQRYVRMLTHTLPLESKLVPFLPDALNAEIVAGTVATLAEAAGYLAYTFLHVRMMQSPTTYGLRMDAREKDPQLGNHRLFLAAQACQRLDEARMVRSHPLPKPDSPLGITDLGRVASHYYIHHETVEAIFNEALQPDMTHAQLFACLALAKEFASLKVREEESAELRRVARNMPIASEHAPDSVGFKIAVLLQAALSAVQFDAFTLHSDMAYVAQNCSRMLRAMLEIAIARGWARLCRQVLAMAAGLERGVWWEPMQSPLRQLCPAFCALDAVAAVEKHVPALSDLLALDEARLVAAVPALNTHRARKVLAAARLVPRPALRVLALQPLTASVVRVSLELDASVFEWRERVHGTSQAYWLIVEDGPWIVHSERVVLSASRPSTKTSFAVPLFADRHGDYVARVESDSGWLGAGNAAALEMSALVLPAPTAGFTRLLALDPLSVLALKDAKVQALYSFSHFNPVQTQCFHALHETDRSVLIGAPTGSGKTVLAELAMWRAFAQGAKAVYVAPLKALVAERMADWTVRLARLGRAAPIELTGDSGPASREVLARADLIVCTPEKLDVVTRGWAQDARHWMRGVGVVVVDEIHLLGEDRGATLEAVVARIEYMGRRSTATRAVRLVGLSTALANASDLANWLGAETWYNFSPAVRPVPVAVHLQSFPGQHYCPRMSAMNKTVMMSIETYSPDKPALVFVASRRQTRLTAMDLIAMCADSDRPRRFLRGDVPTEGIVDEALRDALAFGIALHHAGLCKSDRDAAEAAFASGACQVLVATATLAWGVNLPAHLVVVKGTEFFDAESRRYEPFPVTDVLQMMGRAGRPQFDTSAVAVVLVHDQLKAFYKKFLYEPFPVESQLLRQLPGVINAEVASGRIRSFDDAIDLMSWTFFARRVAANPSYYGLQGNASVDALASFVRGKVRDALAVLQSLGLCVLEGKRVTATPLAGICSRFDLKVTSAARLRRPTKVSSVREAMVALAGLGEVDVPVRHKDDELNARLAQRLPYGLAGVEAGSVAGKALCLLQAHVFHVGLPIHDYITDTRTVLDACARVVPAMAHGFALVGDLASALWCLRLALVLELRRDWRASPASSRVEIQCDAPLHKASVKGGGAWWLLARTAASGKVLLERGSSVDAGEPLQSVHVVACEGDMVEATKLCV